MSEPVASAPSMGLRLLGRIIDYVILAAAGYGLGRVLGFGFAWLALTSAIVFVYFVVGDVLFGTTIGKAVFKIRVLGAAGERPSVKEAFLREWFVLLGAVPFVGPLLALIAWTAMAITIAKSPLAQGWHDRLAGTRLEHKLDRTAV
jgi:uncharacterized RDD family membrane protein YckC